LFTERQHLNQTVLTNLTGAKKMLKTSDVIITTEQGFSSNMLPEILKRTRFQGAQFMNKMFVTYNNTYF